jgi:hypothetical protein
VLVLAAICLTGSASSQTLSFDAAQGNTLLPWSEQGFVFTEIPKGGFGCFGVLVSNQALNTQGSGGIGCGVYQDMFTLTREDGGAFDAVSVLVDDTSYWPPDFSFSTFDWILTSDRGGVAWGSPGDTLVLDGPKWKAVRSVSLFLSAYLVSGDFAQVVLDDFVVAPPTLWTDVGGGTSGASGPPTLAGDGPLVANTPASVHLTDAPPDTLAVLWLGFSSSPTSAFGGTVFPSPVDVALLVTTDAGGEVHLEGRWPAGIAPVTDVWFQMVIQDGSAAYGVTLSNGLRATTP